MSSIWKKIDIIEVRPYLLQDGDECFYARDYIAEGGFNYFSNEKTTFQNSTAWAVVTNAL